MINRQQIKLDVRNFIRGRWWEAFLASFLVSIAIGAVSGLFALTAPAVSFAVGIAVMPLSVSLTGFYMLYADDKRPGYQGSVQLLQRQVYTLSFRHAVAGAVDGAFGRCCSSSPASSRALPIR